MDEMTGELGGNELNAPSSWQFSIDVAKRWEETFFAVSAPNTRKIALRSAMTMSPDHGGIEAESTSRVELSRQGAVGADRLARHSIGNLALGIEHRPLAGALVDDAGDARDTDQLGFDRQGTMPSDRLLAVAREAAMTKLLASETAVKVTDEAARIFASYGLAMEYPVQRYFRDARFLLPGGGTSEILRLVIGRELDWDRGQAFT